MENVVEIESKEEGIEEEVGIMKKSLGEREKKGKDIREKKGKKKKYVKKKEKEIVVFDENKKDVKDVVSIWEENRVKVVEFGEG